MGGLLAGIQPVWASEIEPFPVQVTTKRLPFMKHYGDVSTMDGGNIESVDIITFGSPCQDMSVAGRRAGLSGDRSCLFYQAIRIIQEMRRKTNGRYPRYIVWENVPGAFSSNRGEDFRAVLEAVIRIKEPEAKVPAPDQNQWPTADIYMGDGWSVAYRVFDAQFWGVPQRRKRIYLVADFAGQCAPKILFESEGLSGYSAEGFRTWQGAARSASDCAGAASCICLNDQGGRCMAITENVSATLRAESHGHLPCVIGAAGFCTEHSAQARGIGYEEGTSPTLRAGTVPAAIYENHSQDTRYTGPLDTAPTVNATYGMGGNNQPFVVETPKTLKIRSGCEGGGKGALIQDNKSATLGCNNDQTVFVPRSYGICSKQSQAMLSDNPKSGFYEASTSRCLDGSGSNPSCNQGGVAVVEQEKTYAMTTGDFTQIAEEISPPLMARDYKDPPVVNETGHEYIVRRLTPTECARLQGFPDWWCDNLGTEEPNENEIQFWTEVFETHRSIVGTSSKPKSRNQIIKWLKKPHSDSAEYKMWGNGVALPIVYFVLSGIVYYAQLSGK